MSYRQLAIKLPIDRPPERYAVITHAVHSLVDAAGLAAEASVVVAELNQTFSVHSVHYPQGCSRL